MISLTFDATSACPLWCHSRDIARHAKAFDKVRSVKLTSRVTVIGVCFALLAGCSGPEPQTLESATQNLINDGNELLSSPLVQRAGALHVTEKAEKAKDTACVPGTTQRFFRAQGNFTPSGSRSPITAAGLVHAKLLGMDYDRLIDELDFFDDDLAVTVLHRPESGVTFLVATRITEPNILIVGKTDCLKP
ncbi:hypothetical protein [Acrocarpospora sp. B8E8]|uniref:hypothetical protein n=1 Tax=Acrocarpospora sp. B8E8 TaxID=3153572 RepID=UPI00325ED899